MQRTAGNFRYAPIETLNAQAVLSATLHFVMATADLSCGSHLHSRMRAGFLNSPLGSAIRFENPKSLPEASCHRPKGGHDHANETGQCVRCCCR